jgi:predicted Zn finger-like uncharacterized protein
MSNIQLRCPECKAVLKADRPIPAGKKVRCPQCNNRFEPGLAESDTVNGRPDTHSGEPNEARPEVPGYTVLGTLGHGGMAVVYKARQLALDRLVALKMILAAPMARPQEISRFRTEAAAIAQLQHPNVVQIYEVGEHKGLPYLALELVNGPTLAKRLAGAPQPSRSAAQLVETLARAIAVTHDHGIIHRDLKPSNVLLAPLPGGHDGANPVDQLYGMPKITDFGLAKRLNTDSALTRTGDFLGTASYVAPEQARGETQDVGPGVDVYALGAVLYEMLTGRPPFRAPSLLETLSQVTTQEPVPPTTLQPSVPRDLEAICLKCLNKQPAQRYSSARYLADDLRRFVNGEPTQARPPGGVDRLKRWCLRNPVPAGLLAAITLCLLLGFWYVSRLSDQLVHAAALDNVAQQADVLQEVNDSYSDVVKRAQNGGLKVTHAYVGDPAAIPIPATFTIELGQQISERSHSGVEVRLYSDYPFRSRRHGGPRDDFERDALERLRENPRQPVYRFEEYKGHPALRYATARLMEQTCVDCHNNHPDSPKTDWSVGDVRGVVEIIHPLERDEARTHAGLRDAFLLIGGVCAALIVLAGTGFVAARLHRRRLVAVAKRE